MTCGIQIQAAFQWQKQASNTFQAIPQAGSSDSCNTMKSSETVLLVSSAIMRQVLLLISL